MDNVISFPGMNAQARIQQRYDHLRHTMLMIIFEEHIKRNADMGSTTVWYTAVQEFLNTAYLPYADGSSDYSWEEELIDVWRGAVVEVVSA